MSRPLPRPARRDGLTLLEAVTAVTLLSLITAVAAVNLVPGLLRTSEVLDEVVLQRLDDDARALARNAGDVDPSAWLVEAASDHPMFASATLPSLTVDEAGGLAWLADETLCLRLAVDRTGGGPGTVAPAGACPADAAFDLLAPDPPTGLAATASDAAAQLTWADPADADLAWVQVFVDPDGAGPQAGQADAVVAAGVQAARVALAPGTTADVWVVAVDTSGNLSAASASVAVTAARSGPLVLTPTNVVATAGGVGELVVQWDTPASADTDQFRISWRVDGCGCAFTTVVWATVPDRDDLTQTYTLTGLAAGTDIEVTVAMRGTYDAVSTWSTESDPVVATSG